MKLMGSPHLFWLYMYYSRICIYTIIMTNFMISLFTTIHFSYQHIRISYTIWSIVMFLNTIPIISHPLTIYTPWSKKIQYYLIIIYKIVSIYIFFFIIKHVYLIQLIDRYYQNLFL